MNAFSTRTRPVSERRAADESAPGLRAQMTRSGDPSRKLDPQGCHPFDWRNQDLLSRVRGSSRFPLDHVDTGSATSSSCGQRPFPRAPCRQLPFPGSARLEVWKPGTHYIGAGRIDKDAARHSRLAIVDPGCPRTARLSPQRFRHRFVVFGRSEYFNELELFPEFGNIRAGFIPSNG
jgi:hypothetical protein